MRWLRLSLALLVLALAAAPAAAQGPALAVQTPEAGATIAGSEVTVRFIVTGLKLVPTTVPVAEAGKRPDANKPGEGHLHLTLDLQPLVVWERAEPYTFTNVPPGEHQLMVELANNDHSPLSPRVMQTITFRTEGARTLPETGGLTAGWPALAILALALVLIGGRFIASRRAHGM